MGFLPKIHLINLQEKNFDFLLLGNEGIFKDVPKEEIGKSIIANINEILSENNSNNDILAIGNNSLRNNIHAFTGFILNEFLKKLITAGSKENLTGIMIMFRGLEDI